VWYESMCGASEPISLLKEIERAERVLDSLLQRLSKLYHSLEEVESNLRVSDFSSSGMFVQGLTNGIICILTANIKGDPIYNVLESLKGKGLKLSAIIKGSDRSEAPDTCDSILKIIKAKFNHNTTRLIINLRWSALSALIDKDNVVIIGTRFIHGSNDEISRFKKNLKELNLEVFEDDGEFGGGLLTYKLTNFAKNIDSLIVLELTLSSTLLENTKKVAEILEMVSTV
jgi:hypothetical protein